MLGLGVRDRYRNSDRFGLGSGLELGLGLGVELGSYIDELLPIKRCPSFRS